MTTTATLSKLETARYSITLSALAPSAQAPKAYRVSVFYADGTFASSPAITALEAAKTAFATSCALGALVTP